MEFANPTDAEIREILRRPVTVAVVGCSDNPARDSLRIAMLLKRKGFRVIPVNPGQAGHAILGEKVYRRLVDVPGDIDMVDVFRRSHDVTGHVEDILAKKPHSVWLQSGIRNDAAAEIFAKAGIKVVQDR